MGFFLHKAPLPPPGKAMMHFIMHQINFFFFLFQLIFLNEQPNNVITLCKSAIFMQSKEQILGRLIREQRMQIQRL